MNQNQFVAEVFQPTSAGAPGWSFGPPASFPARPAGRRHCFIPSHFIVERLRRSRLSRRLGTAPDPASDGRRSRTRLRGSCPDRDAPHGLIAVALEGGHHRRHSPRPTEVKRVLDYANTGDPTMISDGGNLTVVVATVGAVQEKQAVTALQHAIDTHPS